MAIIMDIIISQRLRELRRQKGNTQEDLANFLSVSAAAVSKWERNETYPDLTFVPRIASYYDVTVDSLLGIDEMRKKERIDWYYSESMKLQRAGRISESVALWREGKKEFPNDLFVLANLSFALCFDVNADQQSFQEAITLDERILRESADQKQRVLATERLCKACNAIGEKQKALEYADTANSLFHSAELMKLDVLEGDEKDRHAKWLIKRLASYICTVIVRGVDSVDWLYRYEFIIGLLELVHDDDFMGLEAGTVCNAHYFCARIYAEHDNKEKVIYHLQKLTKYLEQRNRLQGKFSYGSTLLKGLQDDTDMVITNSERSDVENYRIFLTNQDSFMFDKWRGEDWFQDVLGRLSE